MVLGTSTTDKDTLITLLVCLGTSPTHEYTVFTFLVVGGASLTNVDTFLTLQIFRRPTVVVTDTTETPTTGVWTPGVDENTLVTLLMVKGTQTSNKDTL